MDFTCQSFWALLKSLHCIERPRRPWVWVSGISVGHRSRVVCHVNLMRAWSGPVHEWYSERIWNIEISNKDIGSYEPGNKMGFWWDFYMLNTDCLETSQDLLPLAFVKSWNISWNIPKTNLLVSLVLPNPSKDRIRTDPAQPAMASWLSRSTHQRRYISTSKSLSTWLRITCHVISEV